jgi:hypothetical protein
VKRRAGKTNGELNKRLPRKKVLRGLLGYIMEDFDLLPFSHPSLYTFGLSFKGLGCFSEMKKHTTSRSRARDHIAV